MQQLLLRAFLTHLLSKNWLYWSLPVFWNSLYILASKTLVSTLLLHYFSAFFADGSFSSSLTSKHWSNSGRNPSISCLPTLTPYLISSSYRTLKKYLSANFSQICILGPPSLLKFRQTSKLYELILYGNLKGTSVCISCRNLVHSTHGCYYSISLILVYGDYIRKKYLLITLFLSHSTFHPLTNPANSLLKIYATTNQIS